jgi:hypothetical protein
MGASDEISCAGPQDLSHIPPGERRFCWQAFAVGITELRVGPGLQAGVRLPLAVLKLMPLSLSEDPDCAAGHAIHQCHWTCWSAILPREAPRDLLPELLWRGLEISGQACLNRQAKRRTKQRLCLHRRHSHSTPAVQQGGKLSRGSRSFISTPAQRKA